jgi:hypothetical protein
MAKRHQHEEHVNHDRWLVSFADMMTLLFALFVVLYALSSVKLEKLKELKKSVQWAFHIAGEGKTRDEGVFDRQQGGGEMPMAVPLINAQDGAMKEFLMTTLPREFEEVTGSSLDVVVSDDTLDFRAPLASFFEAGKPFPIRSEVMNWLGKVVQGSVGFTSEVRVVIETPDVLIGERHGKPLTSLRLCDERLWTLRQALRNMPEVRPHSVRTELGQQRELPAIDPARAAADWEQRAQVILAFSTNRD